MSDSEREPGQAGLRVLGLEALALALVLVVLFLSFASLYILNHYRVQYEVHTIHAESNNPFDYQRRGAGGTNSIPVPGQLRQVEHEGGKDLCPVTRVRNTYLHTSYTHAKGTQRTHRPSYLIDLTGRESPGGVRVVGALPTGRSAVCTNGLFSLRCLGNPTRTGTT